MAKDRKRVDFEVHQGERRRVKRGVNAVIMCVFLLYLLFLFPKEWLDFINASVAERRQALEPFLAFVGSASLAGLFSWAVSFLLFTSDPLLRGSSRIAKWFRSMFAAHAAKEKYDCTDDQARVLWFKYFDTWAVEGSPNRHLLAGTYAATYGARAILYVQWTTILVLVMIAGTMVVHWRLFDTYVGEDGTVRFTIHTVIFAVLLAALIAISAANRLPSARRQATGCWARVEEVFGSSKALFEQDVLRNAPTLEKAFERVEALRLDLLAKRA